MNIYFKGKEKSITSFEWLNIPKLVILTGINGSGKTQLLNIIRNHTQNGIDPNKDDFRAYPTYRLKINNIKLERNSVLFWNDRGININLEQPKFGYNDLKFIVQFIKNHINNFSEENKELLKTKDNEDYNIGKNKLKHRINHKINDIIISIENSSGLEKSKLTPEIISYHLPEDLILQDIDLFNQDSLDFIFFMYLYKKTAYENKKSSVKVGNTPPWEILNEVLFKAQLPYQVTYPNKDLVEPIFNNALNDVETNRFSIQLIDPRTEEDIGFNNLSSGERIIASLALLLYYTQNRNQHKKLLILDEPDAHLHPTLTKRFFDVINDVIIEKYHGRVIMTTHSPSTVAIAPEESIFVKHKTDKLIDKSTKDKALSVLTSGLPFFSVNYKNRRQVFVESHNDVMFYEKIYRKLSFYLEPEISLSFISSGESRTDKNGQKIANCDQVINITSKLRKAGNNLVWGIIDWDAKAKNTSKDNIVVLGNGKRYSIENYIFDPLVLVAFLLREKIITRNEIDLDEKLNYTDFKDFDNEKLQNLVDYLINLIGSEFSKTENTQKNNKLVNEKEIKIPEWYLLSQGHLLEEKILKIFPQLNAIKKDKEDALKISIIETVFDDVPDIISKDFINLFTEIQR